MRLLLTIAAGLVLIVLLWKALHWALGLAMGVLWIGLLLAALVLVIGLIRRLVKM